MAARRVLGWKFTFQETFIASAKSYLSREEVRFDVASEVLDGALLEIVGNEIRENPANSPQSQLARDLSDNFFVRIFL